MKPLIEHITDMQEKQMEQESRIDEILLDQAEMIVSQEYAACLLELQTI